MTRPDEVTEYLRCGGANCDNACASMFDRLGVEDCKTWRVHGYVQQLEERVAHLDALNQQNLSVITMQERTRARLVEQISQLESLAPRWISVEERLPEVDKRYDGYEYSAELLVYDGLRRRAAYYCHTSGVWYDSRYEDDTFEVTHWMPMPEPPKEGTC